ncbi:Ig-like domain-containing protein [Zobellia roscoffensis]
MDIDDTTSTITVTVPDGTNLNTAPSVLNISPNATVTPAIGDIQDFSQPVAYTVTAENIDERVWTVNVTVTENQAPIANDDTTAVELGETVRINVIDNDSDVDNPNSNLVISGVLGVQPENAGSFTIDGQEIVFTSSGDYTGDATFGYTINDGNPGNDDSAVVTVTISDTEVPVSNITVSSVRSSIPDNETEAFSANVLPGNADNKVVNWTSSNTSVATVNATTGLVTAVSSGTTNIIATATDGSNVTGSAALEVTATEILVSNITVSSVRSSIPDNETEAFSANVLPGNADNKVVNWTSSNTSVATVNATTGLVTAVSSGTTNIIATATDGSNVTGSAALEVTAPLPSVLTWDLSTGTLSGPANTIVRVEIEIIGTGNASISTGAAGNATVCNGTGCPYPTFDFFDINLGSTGKRTFIGNHFSSSGGFNSSNVIFKSSVGNILETMTNNRIPR